MQKSMRLKYEPASEPPRRNRNVQLHVSVIASWPGAEWRGSGKLSFEVVLSMFESTTPWSSRGQNHLDNAFVAASLAL